MCTFSSSAVYFYQCVYQKLCLRCLVPSREGLYEWDMLPIKILKKRKKKKEASSKKQAERSIKFIAYVWICSVVSHFAGSNIVINCL